MNRWKKRDLRPFVPKRRGSTTRDARIPEPVQPTPEALLRRAETLGIDIKLAVDPQTNRLMWDNSHDLNAAVDALTTYRAAHG